MSGSRPRPAPQLALRASRALTTLVLGVHGAAAAVAAFTLPLVAGLPVACLIIVLGGLLVRSDTLLVTGNAPANLELGADGGLVARLRGGGALRGTASPRRYVSRWLVVLDLARPDASRRTILVARDMLPAGEFRQLRLWALWGAVPAGGTRGDE